MFRKSNKNQQDNFPKTYSINLMWINRALDENHRYICDADTKELFIANVLDKARKWKKANPESEVNLWYDSKFVKNAALQRTQDLLNEKALLDPDFGFKLKDIRTIDIIRKNPDAFSDYVPVYFRVDLLKLILCVNSIESDGMDAAIFSDLEVGDLKESGERMNKKKLFNQRVMQSLRKIGIQVNESEYTIFDENQFIQLINLPATLNAIKTYINACLNQAITALNTPQQSALLPNLCCAVFQLMEQQLFPLITVAVNNENVLVRADLFEPNPKEEWITYDMLKHGHLPLGNAHDSVYKTSRYIQPGKMMTLQDAPSFKDLIKLPEQDRLYSSFSRTDTHTRAGEPHFEQRDTLVVRPPADGESYKFQPYALSIDLALSARKTP